MRAGKDGSGLYLCGLAEHEVVEHTLNSAIRKAPQRDTPYTITAYRLTLANVLTEHSLIEAKLSKNDRSTQAKEIYYGQPAREVILSSLVDLLIDQDEADLSSQQISDFVGSMLLEHSESQIAVDN